jgi:hypothetical protein
VQRHLAALSVLALTAVAMPLPAAPAKTKAKPYRLHLFAPSKEDTGHTITFKAWGRAKNKRELVVLYHAFGKCAKTAGAAKRNNGHVFIDRDVGPGKFMVQHKIVFISPGNGDFCGYLVRRARGLDSKPSARASRHITIF